MRSACSMSTATTRDTPDSGMVTPTSCPAISMVILLWLMNRNWVCADILFTSSQKRSVFASSSGASTSSSRQKGAGLSWNSANTSAIATRAFSPPESRWMEVLRFPGGWAVTCTPATRISSPVMISFASPPPNSTVNSAPKWRFTVSKVSRSSSRVSRSMRRIASTARLAVDAPDRVLERAHGLVQVVRLRVEEVLALPARSQLVERRHVDRSELGDRLRDARDLALQDRRPGRLTGHRLEQHLVRARFAQLGGELFAVDGGRLLLQ